MGQQQLLLIVLATVIVGLAVAAAVTLLNTQASATNRDEVANDLMNYASRAQLFYRRPSTLGGGGQSFAGMTMTKLTPRPSNANGTYSLTPDPAGPSLPYVTLTGIGTEVGNDGTSNVKVVMYVYPDSVRVDDALSN